MKIVHIITGLAKASGVTTFVENVVREQRALGHEVEIVTSAVHLHLSPSPSLIHIHGLWSPLLHRASRFAARHAIPVVWSTHGMTAPWSLHHKWWKKCLPWYLYQRPDLRRAALIHCTTDLEEGWNQALGFTNTFIAPLGTTLPVDAFVSNASPVDANFCSRPQKDQPSAVDLLSRPTFPQPRTLLYVGRIYPVKALDNVIRAASLMKKQIKFRIVGPDQSGHKAELESLAVELGVRDKFDFLGPKYDEELSAEYDRCDGLILVSHTENFGATVVDAMAHGKPVITSTQTPWKIVADKRCGWWVNNDPESLSKAFSQLLDLSTRQHQTMGAIGRKLVEARYTWPAVAHNILSHYGKILGESTFRHI